MAGNLNTYRLHGFSSATEETTSGKGGKELGEFICPNSISALSLEFGKRNFASIHLRMKQININLLYPGNILVQIFSLQFKNIQRGILLFNLWEICDLQFVDGEVNNTEV